MKDKKILSFILIFIFCIMASLITSSFIINSYKNVLIKNTANITNQIIKHYPQLEEEIIKILDNKDIDESMKLLNKYGIDIDTILSLNGFNQFRDKTIFLNIILALLILITLSMIYYFKNKKELHHKKKLEKYIKSILNDEFNFNFSDYNETSESIEINNIYQLTTKLKKQRDLYLSDKKNLEVVLSDISHQLKTPLTSLFVINELLLNKEIDEIDKNNFIAKSNSQLKRIEWLVTSLLKIAKMDSKTIIFKKEEFNIIILLQEIKDELAINFELKNQELVLIGDKNIKVISDYNWLKEALLNVIKNAHEHGYENYPIEIEVIDNPIYVDISIRNHGKTIDKSDLKNLFNRFFKGKNSTSSSIGIGLNMTKNILENNGGSIKVESVNEYTTFIIKLYKNIK